MATILGRAYTGGKDGHTLGEIQGEATGLLELYGNVEHLWGGTNKIF